MNTPGSAAVRLRSTKPDVLVLGASGFLGSHIVHKLVARGRRVRVFARTTSDCSLTTGLPIERTIGDIGNRLALQEAMRGIDTIYHCIVNTKAWLRDPAPLYAVNVEGLNRTLAVANAAGVRRFVLTSSFATIAPRHCGVSDESDEYGDTGHLPRYIQCRIEAERLFFNFIASNRMEGLAGCVSNTFGARDIGPTPQGQLIRDASQGRLPFYWDGGSESVGIEDAAEGMVLMGERGQSGQRYIFTDRWISYRELFETAARCNGRQPRLIRFPAGLMKAAARMTECCASLLDIENRFNLDAIRCSNELGICSNQKARQELGWNPRPLAEAIEAAVAYFNHGAGFIAPVTSER